jgi:hypothetical protein
MSDHNQLPLPLLLRSAQDVMVKMAVKLVFNDHVWVANNALAKLISNYIHYRQ